MEFEPYPDSSDFQYKSIPEYVNQDVETLIGVLELEMPELMGEILYDDWNILSLARNVAYVVQSESTNDIQAIGAVYNGYRLACMVSDRVLPHELAMCLDGVIDYDKTIADQAESLLERIYAFVSQNESIATIINRFSLELDPSGNYGH